MSLGTQLLRGLVAGAVATVPFTVVAALVHRRLPPRERYPLPPSLITERLEEMTGTKDDLAPEQHRALTVAAHFGYGATTGAAYAALAPRLPVPGIVSGPAFGLAVWSASYLGWLPALRILRPATEAPAGRNVMMIAAHLVWGLTLGLTAVARER